MIDIVIKSDPLLKYNHKWSCFHLIHKKIPDVNSDCEALMFVGYYIYMDSSVGTWGDTALILSEIFTPDSRGHCFTFWYHMSGQNFGTLRLYINNRYRTMTKNMCTWTTIAN